MDQSKSTEGSRKAIRSGTGTTRFVTDGPVANDANAKVWRGSDRRKPSLMSFIMGAFYARRRHIRRAADQEHAFIDWYPDHLFFAATAIIGLSVVDGFFTVHLVNAGALELDSFLAAVLHYDVASFVLAKIALTVVGVTCIVIISQARLFRNWPMTGVLYGLLAAHLALVVYGYSLTRAMH